MSDETIVLVHGLWMTGSEMALLKRRLRARGYRDAPLLISEYGTLLPYYEPTNLYYDSRGRPFDEARARDYMEATLGYLRTAHDAQTGYRAGEVECRLDVLGGRVRPLGVDDHVVVDVEIRVVVVFMLASDIDVATIRQLHVCLPH